MRAGFHGAVEAIPGSMRRAMDGVAWRSDPRCPRFEDLALLRLSYRVFTGEVEEGELVVARRHGEAIVGVFERIYRAEFPIARMLPIEAYGGDDVASMAANNCSAFNFRVVAGTGTLSQHATGDAIDINPVQNPYIVGDSIQPEAARAYLDRDDVRPGMLVRPGPVVDAFDAIGWEWGGDWTSRKDYHHFCLRR